MAELEREGRRFAVATVVRTRGSTPQVVGAKMLIDDLGRTFGTLGGGCVEGDAFAEARTVLGGGAPSLREYELTEELAWDTGLVCGGTMWIQIEPSATALRVGDRDLLGDVLAASATGRPVALATLLRTSGDTLSPAGKLAVEHDGRVTGTLGDAALDERARALTAEALQRGTAKTVALSDDTELLVEPILAKPRLIVVGGGHVGNALAKQAGLLDYAVTVIEDRPEFAQRDRFPETIEVLHADMVGALEQMSIGWNSFIVVATRGHKLDAHCVRAAVQSDARYIGLLGSRRKTILIARMLQAEGLPEDRIRAVHAPVGLDLGGRTPAEIALSVLAEISLERHGGTGSPLRLTAELFDRAVLRAGRGGLGQDATASD
ncbi:MAG: XdhC family protein [Candidatus Limnocylindrales bacterium]